MTKVPDKALERRKYDRLETPVEVSYTMSGSDIIRKAMTKNISADGLRLETQDKDIAESDIVELKLTIPDAVNPVHAKGRVMWKKKLSLEDTAPFDVGLEFAQIEEDNKNTFLKFFCDLIYSLSKEPKNAKRS